MRQVGWRRIENRTDQSIPLSAIPMTIHTGPLAPIQRLALGNDALADVNRGGYRFGLREVAGGNSGAPADSSLGLHFMLVQRRD